MAHESGGRNDNTRRFREADGEGIGFKRGDISRRDEADGL